MLDDMLTLIGRLGWTEYINMQCTSYYRLLIKFLSALNVDWDGSYGGPKVAIYFRMFNIDHRMSLRMFNELLRFPMVDRAVRDVPSLWQPNPVWLSITCSKRKEYHDRWGRPRIFDSDKPRPLTFVISLSNTYNV